MTQSRGKPVVVVMGILGRTPFAGVAWQVLHYLDGFRRLGFEVWYVEDTGSWPYDPVENTITEDPRYTLEYIDKLMQWCGLPNHWAYRAATDGNPVFGLSKEKLASLFRSADVLVNLTGATVLREEHLEVPVRVYLETDPGLAQIEVALGNQFTIDLLAAHTHHFTFGESLNTLDCPLPVDRFTYLPTRQPISVDWWRAQPAFEPEPCITTVTSWQQSGKDIEWEGNVYLWSKHEEFLRFIQLPERSGRSLELALAGKPEDRAFLVSQGWRVVDAIPLSLDIFRYRDYIFQSHAEFTVAKDQYVRLKTGWFSDRSACYLAAGRPVITQETGFSRHLPTGEGLFAFTTMDEILAAMEALESDYTLHARAAQEIACEFFAAERVVGNLMQQVSLQAGAA